MQQCLSDGNIPVCMQCLNTYFFTQLKLQSPTDSISTFRSSALSFLGAKSPQRELSLSWSFRSAEYSLPRSEYSKCKLSLLGTFAPRSECSKNFRSVELSQCSRPRSHALTPFRLDAPVYRHVNTSSAVPTLSSRRHCMPSSTCPDIPGHGHNFSAGADGDGVQKPVCIALEGHKVCLVEQQCSKLTHV